MQIYDIICIILYMWLFIITKIKMTKTNRRVDIKDAEVIQKYDKLDNTIWMIIDSMWVKQKIIIWWVVNYNSLISNWIKFFTQSIVSHVNFYDEESCCAVWSEDMIWVVYKNYKDENNWKFYYVTKPLDIDRFILYYNFDEANELYTKMRWKWNDNKNEWQIEEKSSDTQKSIKKSKWEIQIENRILEKFIRYCYYKKFIHTEESEDSKHKLRTIIWVDLDNIELEPKRLQKLEKEINEFNAVRNILRLFETKDPKKYIKYYNKYIAYQEYREFLREFIVLGILKKIVYYCYSEYDLKWTLSISISPWDNIWASNKKFFCSEFVADCLLYAGMYPFDIQLSDPESISPWDIMHLRQLFVENDIRLYEIDEDIDHNKIREIEIWEYEKWFIKTYIVEKESEKITFNRQKLIVNIVDMLLQYLAEKIIEKKLKNNKSIPKITRSRKKNIWVWVVSTMMFCVLVLWVFVWSFLGAWGSWESLSWDISWANWSQGAFWVVFSFLKDIILSSFSLALVLIFVVLFLYFWLPFVMKFVNSIVSKNK